MVLSGDISKPFVNLQAVKVIGYRRFGGAKPAAVFAAYYEYTGFILKLL